MNENLSWTSALGDAYVNESDDVANAIQVLRQRAQAAGTLKSTNEQSVTTQDQSIDIEPVDSDVIYVPAYDPWLVYGAPIAAYPDWAAVPGVFYAGPDLDFGSGLVVGAFVGFDWGSHRWDFDWHRHAALHDRAPYVSRSQTFAHRHGESVERPAFAPGPVHIDHAPVFHAGNVGGRSPATPVTGTGQFRGEHGFRQGAFAGFDHGGIVSGYSSRGRSSFQGPAHFDAPMHAQAPAHVENLAPPAFAGNSRGGEAGGFHGGGEAGGFQAGGNGGHR
jgi:hypothetical protein